MGWNLQLRWSMLLIRILGGGLKRPIVKVDNQPKVCVWLISHSINSPPAVHRAVKSKTPEQKKFTDQGNRFRRLFCISRTGQTYRVHKASVSMEAFAFFIAGQKRPARLQSTLRFKPPPCKESECTNIKEYCGKHAQMKEQRDD